MDERDNLVEIRDNRAGGASGSAVICRLAEGE